MEILTLEEPRIFTSCSMALFFSDHDTPVKQIMKSQYLKCCMTDCSKNNHYQCSACEKIYCREHALENLHWANYLNIGHLSYCKSCLIQMRNTIDKDINTMQIIENDYMIFNSDDMAINDPESVNCIHENAESVDHANETKNTIEQTRENNKRE